MRRLIVLAMTLAGLSALLGACGGGEEAGILAVAFRLDEGSPVMGAYVGDPTKDPFLLPAGRYYIEALDQDDVVVSLGAVTVKDGEAVDLPPSLAAAGGAADPERAEPLKTLANFLVDADLAEYAFLEIVTGGLELPPFDPAVEPDAADVESLFEVYTGIAAQEDALRTALSQIEASATVSSGASYVRAQWAPPPGPWDFFKKKANDLLFGGDGFLSWIKRATGEGQRERILAIAEQIPEGDRDQVFTETPVRLTGDAHDFDSWMEEVRQGKLDHELAAIYGQIYSADSGAARSAGQRPIDILAREGVEGVNKGVEFQAEAYKKVPGFGKALDLVGKTKEWDEYARKLAENWPAALEGTAREQYQEALAEKIKEDMKERAKDLPQFTDEYIDMFGDFFAKKAIAAIPQIVPTQGPATAVPTAKATMAFTPARTATLTPTATPAEEATETPAVEETETPAAEETETPAAEETETPAAEETETPAAEETETPAAEPTETPTPEPTETPPPEPTETPTPQAKPLTAVGKFFPNQWDNPPTENFIELHFNSAGGTVSGTGVFQYTGVDTFGDPCIWRFDTTLTGTYVRETGRFEGTYTDHVQACTQRSDDDQPNPWEATLAGNRITGSAWRDFELTVQGQ